MQMASQMGHFKVVRSPKWKITMLPGENLKQAKVTVCPHSLLVSTSKETSVALAACATFLYNWQSVDNKNCNMSSDPSFFICFHRALCVR